MKKVSIKDIAKIAGVSPSAVSLVLNGKAQKYRIGEALAQKILKIASQTGYSPNQVAVSLRTGSSKMIGLLVEDISNQFYATIASAIEDELKKYGYRIVYCSTKNDPKNASDLMNMLHQRQVDGYIITPAEGMESNLISLKEQHKPFILIDRYFPDLDSSYVLVDDYKGVYDGMNHLTENGYHNIAFVTTDLGQEYMNYREKAYKEFLVQHKIKLRDTHLLKIPYKIEPNLMIERITNFITQSNGLIDALFFATNYLCIAGLQSLQQLKKQIPKDMGILCFDDHDIFEIYPPGITAIRQPIKEISQTAVTLLMQRIESPNDNLKHTQIVLPGNLIIRGSTRKKKKSSLPYKLSV
jgi:LacI family transcriptional regulator